MTIFKTSKLSALIFIVVAILTVLNILAYHFFKRWDLTKDQLYSLSATSQETVKKLNDPLTIEVYFGPDLPAQYLPLEQSVKDILAEYASYSGQIKVDYVGPDKMADQAEALNIPKVQFNAYQKDRVEVVNGYLGLSLRYGDKTEIIPVVQDTSNLEYQLTSLVKKITADSLPIIGLVQSNGSLPADGLQALSKEVGRLYQLQSVDLSAEGDIPAEISTLVVPGPQAAMSEAELKKIDQFLMQNKPVFMILDRVAIGSGLSSHVSANNLPSLLQDYGLVVDDRLIFDKSAGLASFTQGYLTFNLPYALWPKLVSENFDQASPMVAKLDNVVLSWATSLDIDQSRLDPQTTVSYLAKTTKQAWRKDGDFSLLPQQQFYNNEPLEQYNVAMELSGKLNSPYGQGSADQAQLVVITDSDFIRDELVARSPANLLLVQNIIDGLSLDSDLATIRAKQLTDHPLQELTDSQKKLIRYANVFGLTLIVIIGGVLRYYLRKRMNRFSLE